MREQLIPTVYVTNHGRDRVACFGEDIDECVVYAVIGFSEMWDECRDSVNCSELGGVRSVVLNVQCLKYVQ